MKSEIKVDDDRVQISRIFDAPRSLVFSFWKDFDHIKQWWGCKETTKVEGQTDFSVGGSFIYVMHIAGVGEFSYKGEFDEIIEPEKIAYHANIGGTITRIVVEFFDLGAQTKLVLTQTGFPAQNICKVVSQGTSESLDKLEALVVSEVLTRPV